MASHSPPSAVVEAAGGRVAGALLVHRHEAALHLLNSISDWPRWRTDIASATGTGESIEFFQPVLFVFIDILSQYFATGDGVWKHLYVGEKLKLLRESGGCGESADARREKLAAEDQRGLLTIFRRKLLPGDFAEMERGLKSITSLLTTQPRYSVRVLLIGDFLQLDVLALLDAELLGERIALEPTCIANTDAAALRAALGDLAKQSGMGFDFVFYTPMSDLDCPALARLDRWRMAISTGRAAAELAESAARGTIATVDLLQSLWTCPIVVNNAAAVSRHETGMGAWLRHQLTRRARGEFCAHANRRLSEYARRNDRGESVSIFDEHALLAKHDDWLLGQPLPGLRRQYPIVLGEHVAAGYRQRIAQRVLTVASRVTSAKAEAAGIPVGS